MYGSTHLAIGVATTLPFVLSKDLSVIPAILGLPAAIGPDYDKKLNMVHRGFSHSAIATWCIYCGVALISAKLLPANNIFIPGNDLEFSIGLNYFSHIFADSFTTKGVQFLWPYKKRLGLKLFTVTKKNDYIIRVLVWIVVACELVMMTELKNIFIPVINSLIK